MVEEKTDNQRDDTLPLIVLVLVIGDVAVMVLEEQVDSSLEVGDCEC